MPIKSALRLSALSAVSAITLAACAIAPPMSEAEQEISANLSNSRFQPATRAIRDSIETQELFAQAAFWSHEYELNPGDLESAIKLSAAVRKLGNANRAVEIAQTTRALYPRDPYLTAEYAAGLIAAERAFEAIAPLDEALRYAPGLARLWSLKGAALDQQEDYDLARKYYMRGLKITPNDPNIMTNMGLSFALSGDPQTAEGWLRRAVSLPGASQSIRQNLALVLQLQGKTEEAEKYMNRSQHANLRKTPALRPAPTKQNTQSSTVPPNFPAQNYRPQNYQPQSRQEPRQAQPTYPPQARFAPPNGAMPGAKMMASGQQNFRSTSDAARAASRQNPNKRMVAPLREHTAEQKSVLEQIAGRLGPKSSQVAQMPLQPNAGYPMQAGRPTQANAVQYGQPQSRPAQTANQALAGGFQSREPARRRR